MDRDRLVGRMLVITLTGLCCCLPLILVGGKVFVEVSEAVTYNHKLRELGVDPTLAGVEDYIWQAIQPGQPRERMLELLANVGYVTVADMGNCDGVVIGLYHNPDHPFDIPVPPSSHPVYRVSVCYSDDRLIKEILSFDMIRDETYYPDVSSTVEARMTVTP